MANGVNASVEEMQPPFRQGSVDVPAAQARTEELNSRHHAALTGCEGRYAVVNVDLAMARRSRSTFTTYAVVDVDLTALVVSRSTLTTGHPHTLSLTTGNGPNARKN